MPKLEGYTVKQFLELLRERGRTSEASELEKKILDKFEALMSKDEIYGLRLDSVIALLELAPKVYRGYVTVEDRMAQLRAEGYFVAVGMSDE